MTNSRTAIEQTLAATTHGRYLVAPADGPAPFAVGFHGYAEPADLQLERLRGLPGAERWTLIAVQALHRFYLGRRNEVVVASWMTRQDRELAIADNLAYVGAVVDGEWARRQGRHGVVFAGFSQGVAMAFRAAAASRVPVLGVIAVGADVPPELDRAALGRIGRVLLCRGVRDEWYSPQKFAADRDRLEAAGVAVTAVELDAAHEWDGTLRPAAAAFLSGILP